MRQILESINQLGLTSAKSCSARGSLKDKSSENNYYHNQIDISNLTPCQLKQALTSLVYHAKEGMWTIAMERHYQNGSAGELTTSIMNSIVFIFELDSLAITGTTTMCFPLRDHRLCQQKRSSPVNNRY